MGENSKYFVDYNTVHKVCQKGAQKIRDYGFKPDLILAIGGGGFVPARMLRTHLQVPIKAVSLELYDDKTDQSNEQVRMLQWISANDVKDRNVLVVDEIDDTRTTLAFCVRELRKMCPASVGIFVLHNKKKEKRMHAHWSNNGFQPHGSGIEFYCAGEEIPDVWIVYPWESNNIDAHCEVAQQQLQLI